MRLARTCAIARPARLVAAAVTVVYGVGTSLAQAPTASDDGRILLFVRSTAPYQEARDDLLAIAPDGIHMPQLSAHPDEAARQEAELRAAGVRYLFRYKDLFTRTPKSLKRMYDRWEEYFAGSALADRRPEVPPEGWAQRGPDGQIRLCYGDQRWMMCPNNPHWRGIAWQTGAGLASRHADGVMCDNPMCQCYCKYCRARFDEWMRERYSREQLREIYALDADQKPLAMHLPDAEKETQRVLLGACRRFWVASMREFFGQVTAGGESVRGEGKFLVAPNCAGHRWFWAQTSRGVAPVWWGDAITTMYVEPGQYAGVGHRSFLCGLQETYVLRNFFDYQYAAARLGDAESVLMKAYTGKLANPAMARLALAEGLALHGAVIIYPRGAKSPSAREMYLDWAMPMIRFAHSEQARQRRMSPAGEIAVLYDPNDMMNGFVDHCNQSVQVCRVLQRQHIPHRLVHRVLLERTLQERRPSLLIVPWMRCLGDEDLALLEEFTGQGGRLLAIGQVATHTFEGRPRAAPGLAWLPRQSEGGLVVSAFHAGNCAHLEAHLSESLPTPCALLHEALYRLVGHSPSALPADRWPALAVNLARSADDGTYWLHLLNYAVSLEAGPEDADAIGVLTDVPVVVPLPASRVPMEVALIRPEHAPASLPFTQGTEGVAVTVPAIEVYALVEVTTKEGERPHEPLLPRTDPRAAGRAAASTVRLEQVAQAPPLQPLPAPRPVALAEEPPALRDLTVWYLRIAQERPLTVDCWLGSRSGGHALDLRLIGLDGTPVAEVSSRNGPTEMGEFGSSQSVSLAVPAPGRYLLLAEADGNIYRMRPRCAAACLEAHSARALHTCDPQPTAPLYFYVPADCEAFTITAAAPQKDESCRMSVMDPEGKVVLDEAGEMDSRQRFHIEAPKHLRGRCWSFTLGPGPTGKQDDIFVTLEGVPPLAAEAPDRLLIPGR